MIHAIIAVAAMLALRIYLRATVFKPRPKPKRRKLWTGKCDPKRDAADWMRWEHEDYQENCRRWQHECFQIGAIVLVMVGFYLYGVIRLGMALVKP